MLVSNYESFKGRELCVRTIERRLGSGLFPKDAKVLLPIIIAFLLGDASGENINEAAEHKLSEEMYVTRVNYNGKCDRFVKKDVLDK